MENRFDPTVERIFNKYIEASMSSGMVEVKTFFQEVFESGYREGYNDGQADAVDYEYHGSMAKERCRY